jgi:nucleoside-diphosphate-sugar epimerase
MKSKTLLVTGGFGYVGSRLTPLLLSQGYQVKVIDLCLYGEYGLEALDPKLKENLTFLKRDIRDPEAVVEAMQGVDTVIHLAAISNDPTGDVDERLTRQTNFDAVGLLLATAKKSGVKRFINASSSSVFGIKHESNVSEALEPEPLTYYSKYKMLSEWLVIAASSPEFCTVNIRPATICGFSPRQRFDLTVNKLTADAVRKGVITVHGGQQRRPNVGMEDTINLYSLLIGVDAQLINGRTFNFGFENLKVIEIAELIQHELKDLNVKINVNDTLDNRDYHISSAKILDVLKYKPVSSIANEVFNLHRKLSAGHFDDIDAPQYYNMKTMKLDRSTAPYHFLSR